MCEEFDWYTNDCKRCGTKTAHSYCHDCQMLGHDPSLENYQE
jgi:predicted amidophosphoribosyltransferase